LDVKEPLHLLDLPPELLSEILSCLITTDRIKVFLPSYNIAGADVRGVPLPDVTLSCKLLRNTYVKAAIERTTFEVHSFPGNKAFQRWLASLDLASVSANYGGGFDAVRKLDFPFASRFPFHNLPASAPNSDVELMKKCKNLTVVSMTWVRAALTDQSGDEKTVNQLREDFRLDGMLELEELKELNLFHWGRAADTEVLHELGGWFEAEYKKRGQDVQVKVY
jgi:hypothetical protein